jgi:hypothetical protein
MAPAILPDNFAVKVNGPANSVNAFFRFFLPFWGGPGKSLATFPGPATPEKPGRPG